MISISREDLKGRIEPHLYDNLANDTYRIQCIKASNLLSYTRLDLAFKLLYLEILQYDVVFAIRIYTEHIRAFSLGEFAEPGNKDKNSIEKYIGAFDDVFKSIKEKGFDRNRTLIPLSKNKSIANGAHRIASAIFLNDAVECVELDSYDHIYDYKFFYQRNVSTDMLDMVATKFVEYSENVYIAFIWPVANSKNEDIEKIIPNIIYQKEMRLNYNGAHNLLSQIYYGEEWLGNIENNFAGVKGKLVECFTTFDPVKVIAFQAENIDKVLNIKEHIRAVFNVGKHSIHITDTKEEALHVARVIFNDNSIHFLNYAKPNNYISTHNKIDTFKVFMQENNLDSKDILLDASMVLSAYGLREARDIDYLSLDNKKINKNFTDINNHDEILIHYKQKKEELIYNPQYHFYFNNLKFVSFPQLYAMKMNRAEEKDQNDCKMMEALIENNWFKNMRSRIKQNIFYKKILYRKKSIQFLKSIGIFHIVRNIYRKINHA